MSMDYLFKAYERNHQPKGTYGVLRRSDAYYVVEYLGDSMYNGCCECGAIAETKNEHLAYSILDTLKNIDFFAGKTI